MSHVSFGPRHWVFLLAKRRRVQVTAVHLLEQVLPRVPYRQWTLSAAQQPLWLV
jgi:hypothetical protein